MKGLLAKTEPTRQSIKYFNSNERAVCMQTNCADKEKTGGQRMILDEPREESSVE